MFKQTHLFPTVLTPIHPLNQMTNEKANEKGEGGGDSEAKETGNPHISPLVPFQIW